MIRKLIAGNLCLLALFLSTAIVNSWTHGSLADVILSGLIVTATDPSIGDRTDRNAVKIFETVGNFPNNAPNFSNQNALELSQVANYGDNTNGGATTAKTTWQQLYLTGVYAASGQRIQTGAKQSCYGMGDCAAWSTNVTYAGGPVNGDEGQGFAVVSYLQQQTTLTLASVTAVSQTACNTTMTQSVTASENAQTVTVASTTGCNVNDWIVAGQEAPTNAPQETALQISAVASGNITGIFRRNYSNGTTITPAKVVTLNLSAGALGQNRLLVNLSGSAYSTGTASCHLVSSACVGGSVDGSGTSWANGMVGGSSLNIGCLAFGADDYSGAPFNGSGGSGTLKSWYQVSSVSSATSLGIYKSSVAGDASYYGKATSLGSYVIRPCAQVLVINGSQVILENTATAWNVNDNVELAIVPWPDVTGFQYQMNQYTPGAGQNYRSFLDVKNAGARTVQVGIGLRSQMATGSNADTVAWDTGVTVGSTNTGLHLSAAHTQAILLESAQAGDAVGDTSGKIAWNGGGTYVAPNTPNLGMDFVTTMSGQGGKLSFVGNGSNGVAYAQYDGMSGTKARPFSSLPACDATHEGLEEAITDSTTVVFNATITGGGSNHVKAYCNMTNWTVH